MGQVVPLVVADGLIDEADARGEAGEILGPFLDGQMAAVDAPNTDPSRNDGLLHPTLGAAVLLVLLGRHVELELPPDEAYQRRQVQRVGGLRQDERSCCSRRRTRSRGRIIIRTITSRRFRHHLLCMCPIVVAAADAWSVFRGYGLRQFLHSIDYAQRYLLPVLSPEGSLLILVNW